MIAFTCPHCGGGVHYDITSQDVQCEYCSRLISRDIYQAYLDKQNSYQTTELICPQCGAVTLSYDNTIATFCSYCGSSVLFDHRIREIHKPEGILPFEVSKAGAMTHYREKIDSILLAPDWMQEEGEQHLTGLYVPFYQYSASMSRPGRFRGTVSTSYSSYTEVKEYQVTGTVQADYAGTRFDAAMAFPDAMSESIDTFEWRQMKKFEPGYVAGYYADGSDVPGEEYDPVALSLIQADINHSTVNYQGMGFDIPDIADDDNVVIQRKKVLFPVWLLTHRVGRDRICYAAINGRSGVTAADIPLDGGKYVKVSLILAAAFALLLNIFFTIIPSTFLLISMVITGLFGSMLGKLANDVYIRENHLDDIGRVGFETFASSLRRSIFRSKKGRAPRPRPKNRAVKWIILGILLFFAGPFFSALSARFFPQIGEIDFEFFTGFAVILVMASVLISGISRRMPAKQKSGWQFKASKLAAFAVLWKIWLALAAGSLVLVSGTPEDMWYYGAGALNILVSLWGAIDLIRKQNRLASREIPVFTMRRGGQE